MKWLKKYQKYILYDNFQYGFNEAKIMIDPDHWVKNHPGPITNTEFLEEDKKQQNLYGSGTDETLQPEWIDQYVESNANQQYDYIIVNAELWEFLFKRYGGNPVKRYYIRNENVHHTSVEAKLMAIGVQFLNTRELFQGAQTEKSFKQWWT